MIRIYIIINIFTKFQDDITKSSWRSSLTKNVNLTHDGLNEEQIDAYKKRVLNQN